MADAEGSGGAVRRRRPRHHEAPQEHLRRGGARGGLSCFHFGNNCRRWEDVQDSLLQPRRDSENRAHRGILMKMADWASFLNSFLELSNYPILADKGKVSAL